MTSRAKRLEQRATQFHAKQYNAIISAAVDYCMAVVCPHNQYELGIMTFVLAPGTYSNKYFKVVADT